MDTVLADRPSTKPHVLIDSLDETITAMENGSETINSEAITGVCDDNSIHVVKQTVLMIIHAGSCSSSTPGKGGFTI